MIGSIVLFALAFVLLIVYIISKWKFDYWKKRNVPYVKPIALFGNYIDAFLMRKHPTMVAHALCSEQPDEPLLGTFFGTEPALLVRDPDLIKLIVVKQFPYFNGREISDFTHCETLTKNLFFNSGTEWKIARQCMSPLFTSSKIKNMFYLVEKCSVMFEDLLDHETGKSKVLEFKGMFARYTMDCICSCGFGIDTDTLAKDVTGNVFKQMGDTIFENSTTRALNLLCRAIWPRVFYGLGRQVFPEEIPNFFQKILLGVFNDRNYKPNGRNDFVDMVLNLKKNEYISCENLLPSKQNEVVKMKVEDEFMLAQCVVFFAAGFETSSTTLTLCLYELAKNRAAQERAMAEVDAYLSQRAGKVAYDCVTDLPYLESCLDETLRLYPVLGLLAREVMEDFTLPNGLKLEKGLRIHWPVYNMHHNPKYFPEPELFKPERFFGDAKKEIPSYTYTPFGEGPRICVGMRIAKMQMLPGILTVLKKYRVELAPDTPTSIKLNPRSFTTSSDGPINLKLVKRDKTSSACTNTSHG